MKPPVSSHYQQVAADEPDEHQFRTRLAADSYKEDMENGFLKEGEEEKPRKKCLTVAEAQLLFLLGLCLIVIVTLSAVVMILNRSRENTCLTTECAMQASLMSSVMNQSAQPCEDFYNYACGNWAKVHVPKPGVGKYSEFHRAHLRVIRILYQQLSSENLRIQGKTSKALIKAQNYFEMCQNEKDSKGINSLFSLIASIGGWTLTPNKRSTKLEKDDRYIADRLARIFELNYMPIFHPSLEKNLFNSSQYILTLEQGGGMFSRSTLIKEDRKTKTVFLNYCTKFFEILGTTMNSYLKKRIEDFWQIEVKLEKMRNDLLQRRGVEKYLKYKRSYFMTVENFVESIDTAVYLTEKTKFTKMLKYTLKYANMYYNNKVVRDSLIFVDNMKYFEKLAKWILIDKPIKKGATLLSDYVTFKLVSVIASKASRRFDQAIEILQQKRTGSRILPEHWVSCTALTDLSFKYVTAAIYAENYVAKETRKSAESLVLTMKKNMKKLIGKANWMEGATRKTAELKASNARYQIAYPDWIFNITKLDDHYKGINIVKGDYFQSSLAIMEFKRRLHMAKYGTTPDNDVFDMQPTNTNAYWQQSTHQMVILSGILQPPFFEGRFQDSFHYGALGGIIGHEMNHGYDSRGSQFNENGDLDRWWSRDTYRKFNGIEKCFIDQYSKYTFFGTKVNGKYTLAENMADNGGIQLAWMSYKEKSRNGNNEQKLPGFKLSADQMFFLSFAQIWCGVYTKAYAKYLTEYDTHSVFPVRVLGTFSNSAAFAKAYSCKLGSRYNPKKKCVLW